MGMFTKTMLTGALALGALFASPAQSQVIMNGVEYKAGSTIGLKFNGLSGASVVNGLGADLTLTYNGINATGDYLFDFTIKNTSTGHPQSEVTAFGFDTSPVPLLSASSEDSPYTRVSSGSIANGYKVLFCLTGGNGGNNCSGGSSTGVDVNETWKGSFVLGFQGNNAPAQVTFSNFHTRYQSTLGGGSATGNLTSITNLTAVSAVPEPEMWATLILGFGAVGFQIRRRNQRLQLRTA